MEEEIKKDEEEVVSNLTFEEFIEGLNSSTDKMLGRAMQKQFMHKRMTRLQWLEELIKFGNKET